VSASQQLLDALVHDCLVQQVELAELADELDVPQHLVLCHHPLFLLIGRERPILLVKGLSGPRPILKLVLALV